MQISDLNSNLLSALTAQSSSSKAEKTEAKTPDFNGLLSAITEERAAITTPDVTVKEDYRNQSASLEVKVENKDHNTANKLEVRKEDNKDKSVKSSASEKTGHKTTENNKPAKTANDNSGVSSDNNTNKVDAPQNTSSENDNETAIASTMVPQVNAINPMPLAIVDVIDEIAVDANLDADLSLGVDVAENAIIIPEEEALSEANLNIVSSENVASKVGVGAEITNLQSVNEEVLLPVEAEDNSLPVFSSENKPTQANVIITPDVVEENNIPEVIATTPEVVDQQEKIAELLPADTNISIKVNVKEDKVTTFNSGDALAVPFVNEDGEVIELNTVEEPLLVDIAENPITDTEIQPVAVADAQKTINALDVVVEDKVSTIAINDNDLSAPMMMSGESTKIVSSHQTLNTVNDSFKDIYNKGLTREVAEQIKVNITQSAIKGVDKIEIQLKPADLGQLEIKLQIGKDGKLQAHIIASNSETLDILQKDLSSLKDAFNNAGYQTDDGSFSFSYRGEEQSNSERNRMRDFIGDVIEQDIAEETAANDYIAIDGVNIRV